MGLTESSTRKLTIPNESQFIRITDDLVDRILACQEKKVKDEKDKGKKKDADCQPTEMENTVRHSNSIPPGSLENSGDTVNMYNYGPSLSALKVLQAKEKELKENDIYWTRRIQNLEDHHAGLKKIMEEKFDEAMNEINNQVPRPPVGAPFPCLEQKNKVIKCYEEHPKEALLCALEVSEFANCVHSKRIASLQEKKEQAAY